MPLVPRRRYTRQMVLCVSVPRAAMALVTAPQPVIKGMIMKRYEATGGYVFGHLTYAVPEDKVSNVRDIDAFMDKLGEILSGYLPEGDDWIEAIEQAVQFSLPKEFTPQQLAEHDALSTYLHDWGKPFDETVEILLSDEFTDIEPHTAYQTVDAVTLGKMILSMFRLLESRYNELMSQDLTEGMAEVAEMQQKTKKPRLRAVPTDNKPSFEVELPISDQKDA